MTTETYPKTNVIKINAVMEVLSRLGLSPEADEVIGNKFYCKCGSSTFNGDCLEDGFFSLAYDMICPESIPVETLKEVSNVLNMSNHLVKVSAIPVAAPLSETDGGFVITRFEISTINLTIAELEKNICSYISYINEVVSLFKEKIRSSALQ